MLVGKLEKIICCWERIMLVDKNHVMVGNTIMVAKDHVGGGRCWLLQIHNSAHKSHNFCTKRVPMCPFAT